MHHLYLELTPQSAPPPLLDTLYEEYIFSDGQALSKQQQLATSVDEVLLHKSKDKSVQQHEELEISEQIPLHAIECQTALFRESTDFAIASPSPVLLALAVPEQSLQQLLQLLHDEHRNELRHVRIVHQVSKLCGALHFASLLLRFHDEALAQRFQQRHNCLRFEKREEHLYLLPLKKVVFYATKLDSSGVRQSPDYGNDLQCQQFAVIAQLHSQQPLLLIQIPTCPPCLERLDSHATGLDLRPIEKLLIYAVGERWHDVKTKCIPCSADTLLQQQRLACQECEKGAHEQAVSPLQMVASQVGDGAALQRVQQQQSTLVAAADIWICLICAHIGCARYTNAHASQHHKNTAHNFVMEVRTKRIWDYLNDTFVHRVVQAGENMLIAMPESAAQRDAPLAHDKYFELIDRAVWEYCYVISVQMEEQRDYFQKQLNTRQQHADEELERRRRRVQELREQLAAVAATNKSALQELEHLTKNQRLLEEKINESRFSVEELQMFNAQMTENIAVLSKRQQPVDAEEQKQPEAAAIQHCQEDAEILKQEQTLAKLRARLEELYKQYEN